MEGGGATLVREKTTEISGTAEIREIRHQQQQQQQQEEEERQHHKQQQDK
jgi:hypothetical protein